MAIDYEEVCKGLACHAHEGGSGDDCPYWAPETCCSEPLCADALALINAQQDRIKELEEAQTARVLTLEEAKKAEVCWLEPRGYEPFATLEADTWNPERYGKSYRCWNHMPTEEQRKAVKWE